MATTLSDLIEETLTFLRGYVRSQEQTTWLTSSITSSDTSLSVANGSRIGMGRVEIDNELLYVDSLSARPLWCHRGVEAWMVLLPMLTHQMLG